MWPAGRDRFDARLGDPVVARVFRVYLALIFLANVGGMANLLLDLETVVARYPKLTDALQVVLFASGIASLAAVALMWRWKVAGLYLIVAAYGVMLGVNLYYEAPPAHTMLGPIGLTVLFALFWTVRHRFRTGGR